MPLLGPVLRAVARRICGFSVTLAKWPGSAYLLSGRSPVSGRSAMP